MGAPTSFTARRPAAGHLPAFELPPPPLSSFHPAPKHSYLNSHPAPATTLTSVGNLLTPPSNSSADGLSPSSSGVTTSSSLSNQGTLPPFTPNAGGMWPPLSNTGTTPYGFQSSTASQAFGQSRGTAIFSPSLNSIVRGNHSPTASESLPPPPYEVPHYQSSMSMSAPNLTALPSQQSMISAASMGHQTPVSASVTQPSPVNAQEAFARPPPTPTYYQGSQPSSTPQQASFPYSTGPSPISQSPMSAGGPMAKMSPVNAQGPVPSVHAQPHAYSQQRPYTYPMPGPVLSNVNNPGGQLALVGGVPHGMMPGFNSGHAAHMQHMYGHAQPQNPQNDRPFRCDQCPQSFNRNHDLKRHKRIHLAVKPFPCGHCDKSFSRKDALKRHVLVKGCGKAQATADVKEIDGSISPETKSESLGTSPIIAASA